MTPRDMDQLHPQEYAAMLRWIEREARERKRAERRARR